MLADPPDTLHVIIHSLNPQRADILCRFKPSLDLSDGMLTMGYLTEGRKGFMGGLSKVFGNNENAVASPGEAAAKADMYICVNASNVELVDIKVCGRVCGRQAHSALEPGVGHVESRPR